MSNDAKVTMNDGSLVFTVTQPLSAPMAMQTTKAIRME